MAGLSAALVCAAAIVCVFTVRDFRVGVMMMILIMPISASYIFPRSMFGLTGLNPLNVLLVGTFASYLMVAAPDGSLRRFMPWMVLVYVAPMAYAAVNGMKNVPLIPPDFYLENMLDFNNAFGYVRDEFLKPLIMVAYALMIAAAYARSRDPDKFITPAIISMWIMAGLAIVFFLNAGVKFGQLAGEFARSFFSPLGMHANDLGRLYATAMAILLFTWDRARRPMLKTMLFLTMGVVGIALMLTFSRAAITSCVLIGLFYVVSRRNKKTLLMLAFAIPFVLIFTPGAIWYRLEMGADEGAAGMSAGRVSDIWTPLIPQIFDKPFFGHGLQSVLWAPAMRLGEMMQVTHPHSAYIGAIMDTGVIGALMILAFWFTCWKGFRQMAKDPLLPPHEQGFFEGAAAALIAFVVAGFVGSSFLPVPEQSFLWLAVGLMFGVKIRRKLGEDAARKPAIRPAPVVAPRQRFEHRGKDLAMCGITGYWARRGDPSPWMSDLGASVESLRARGPDDHGVWMRQGGRVAMGHTRLSILDLSPLGHQPMRSPDGALTMIFNGEVYNFAAVRAELEALGHRFRSSGDSEVLLAALQEWGVKAVDKFVGMFAIAVWNERERRLVLLRDRMGVKPLYYAWDGSQFWFGSELKALRAFRAWRPKIDRDAVGEFLQYGYVSAPRSIYANVSKLEPGHWLELGEVGEPVAHRYWSPVPKEAALEGTEDAIEQRLEMMMVDACRYRMVSDVPVGVFLSGGVDSSLVAALLQRYGGGDVRTFTIGFDDPRYNEAPWAKKVANHLGTQHTEKIVTARDMLGVLTEWAELFDEPFGDQSGVPTYLVAKMARQHVKVALSADGGDELFSGYSHYGVVLERERSLSRLPGFARRALGAVPHEALREAIERAPLPAAWRHRARRDVVERLEKLHVLFPALDRATMYDLAMSFWTPWEIGELMGAPTAARPGVKAADFADQMSLTDMRHYLPDDILVKVDRTTMAAGLEGRDPLLDHRLVELAMRLPLSMRRGELGAKHILKKILYRHIPRELIDRPKQGFAIPLGHWLRGELAPLLDQYLDAKRVKDAGIFDPDAVRRAVANFREGGPANERLDVQKLWHLLAFEMWRSRWEGGTETNRDEGFEDARAVHCQ